MKAPMGEAKASEVLDEMRGAYAAFGIRLAQPATYGTYYGLHCDRCGEFVGSTGDRLLPGMIHELLDQQFDLYAAGLIGCHCGRQAECARALDPARFEAAWRMLGG